MAGHQRLFRRVPLQRGISTIIISSFNMSIVRVRSLEHLSVPLVNVGIPIARNFDTAVNVSRCTDVHLIIGRLRSLKRHEIYFMYSRLGRTPLPCDTSLHSSTFLHTYRSINRSVRPLLVRIPHRISRPRGCTVSRLLAYSPQPATIYYLDSKVTVPLLFGLVQDNVGILRSVSLINFSSDACTGRFGLAAIRRRISFLNTRTKHLILSLVHKRRPRIRGEILSACLTLETSATPLSWI